MSAADDADSAPGQVAVYRNPIPGARPFQKGHPSANPGGLTKAERDWRRALDEKHIPKASDLLDKIRIKAEAAADAGDLLAFEKLAALWFKICGLVRKPPSPEEDGARFGAAMAAWLEALRARRAQEMPDPPP